MGNRHGRVENESKRRKYNGDATEGRFPIVADLVATYGIPDSRTLAGVSRQVNRSVEAQHRPLVQRAARQFALDRPVHNHPLPITDRHGYLLPVRDKSGRVIRNNTSGWVEPDRRQRLIEAYGWTGGKGDKATRRLRTTIERHPDVPFNDVDAAYLWASVAAGQQDMQLLLEPEVAGYGRPLDISELERLAGKQTDWTAQEAAHWSQSMRVAETVDDDDPKEAAKTMTEALAGGAHPEGVRAFLASPVAASLKSPGQELYDWIISIGDEHGWEGPKIPRLLQMLPILFREAHVTAEEGCGVISGLG